MIGEPHAAEGCYNPAPRCNLTGQPQQFPTRNNIHDQVDNLTHCGEFNHCFKNPGYQKSMEQQEESMLLVESWYKFALTCAIYLDTLLCCVVRSVTDVAHKTTL